MSLGGSGPSNPAACRADAARIEPQPVSGALAGNRDSGAFQQKEVCRKVIPVYMGRFRQSPDQQGRILDHLEPTGASRHMMIVRTSDRGDCLGDHWQGEKDLAHDLAKEDGHEAEIMRLHDLHVRWARQTAQRVTRSEVDIEAM
jgi:arylsulfatase A-like enzyme